MAEAKKGGGSSGKGAKGKKPDGKSPDPKSSSKSKANKPDIEPEKNKPASEDSAETATETAAQDEPAAETTTPETVEAEVEKSEEPKAESKPEPAIPAEVKPAPKAADSAAAAKTDRMQQQHVSRILDAVLDEPVQESSGHHGFKHPLFLDVILAVGLLLAMAGFSIGMFKIYITHSAKQSINQQNYKAAIALLKGTPLPGFFNIAGSEDTQELLNRALYLDAISKLELNREDPDALQELEQIRPGSGYFELAQDLLRDNTRPSKLQLEGGASHDADPNDPEIKEQKPILPEDGVKDASP